MPGARSHDLPYVLGLTEVSQDQSRDGDEPSGAASAAPRAPPLEGLEVSRRDHEVARLRVMEHERRHRRLGVHHVAFGQVHADRALHVEDAEELLLVLETRAGGVAEAHPHAAVARLRRMILYDTEIGLGLSTAVENL